jgi:hypothetical protein
VYRVGVRAQPQFLSEKGKFQEQRKYMDMYVHRHTRYAHTHKMRARARHDYCRYGADKKKKGFLSGDFPKRDEYSNVYVSPPLHQPSTIHYSHRAA